MASKLEKEFPELRWIELDLSAPPLPEYASELRDSLGYVCIGAAPEPFQNWWAEHIGGPAPGVFTEDQSEDQRDLGGWLMQALMADRAELAAQFAGLSGQIGHLRKTARDQSEEIDHLRQRVDGQQKRFLFEIAAQEGLTLASGAVLKQRLPGEAVGLAGLIVPLMRGGTGRLVIRLIVTEDQAEMARWQVDDPEQGVLRLSLHGPLRQPRRSAQLEVEWQGEDSLEWGAAPMDDPLYGAQIDGVTQPACLAMRGKNHDFGNGVEPLSPLQNRPVMADILIHANSHLPKNVQWMDMEQALLVHPTPDRPTAAYVPALIFPDIAQIRIDVETQHTRAQPISYAIGIAPHGADLGEDGLPEFALGCVSDWLTISARDRHTLTLKPPVQICPHDLWLMTRLPDGVRDSSWGWATFSGLSLWT